MIMAKNKSDFPNRDASFNPDKPVINHINNRGIIIEKQSTGATLILSDKSWPLGGNSKLYSNMCYRMYFAANKCQRGLYL